MTEVLKDSTNRVEAVQLEASLPLIQSPPPKEPAPNTEEVVYELPKMTSKNGIVKVHQHLPNFSDLVQNNGLVTLRGTFDEHVIEFQLFRTYNGVSAMIICHDPVSGEVYLQLVGRTEPSKGEQEKTTLLSLEKSPLTNEAIVSLGRLDDVQVLMLINTHIYLTFAVLIKSKQNGAPIDDTSHNQQAQEKIQRSLQIIKQLMEEGKYTEIEKVGDEMDKDDFLKCLCSTITNMKHYEGLSKYMERHKMLPTFLVHGNMTFVKQLIIAKHDAHNTKNDGFPESTTNALVLTMTKNMDERFIHIVQSVQTMLIQNRKRYLEEPMVYVEDLITCCFVRLHNDINPARRFITLCGEDLKNKCPYIFDIFCKALVHSLKSKDFSNSKKLTEDLIGQPSLLTPTTFVGGALKLNCNDGEEEEDRIVIKFINYGWKEAVAEGLKEGEHDLGGEFLWKMMTKYFPTQFSGEYPESDEWRLAVCAHLKSKEELEMEWAESNAEILQAKLASLNFTFELLDSLEIWGIVSGYAIAWTDIDYDEEEDDEEEEI